MVRAVIIYSDQHEKNLLDAISIVNYTTHHLSLYGMAKKKHS